MPDLRKIFVGAAAAILFYQLILPPVVGLADNGDFAKVIGRFSMHGKVYETGMFIDTTYEIAPKWHWVGEFLSSEIPLAAAALGLNWIVSKDGNFDLRFIGVVHAALFLAALWLFVPLLDNQRRAVRIAILALAVFIYCDVMYVSSMNSFYMDESSLLFLLLSVVLYFRLLRWHKTSDAVLLIISAMLLATSKTQHAPVAWALAALLVATRKSLWPGRAKVIVTTAACVVAATGLFAWKGLPEVYAELPLYNTVFLQILPHSKDVSRTMADLGLDDSYRPLIGKNAFFPDSRMDDPVFRAAFGKHVSAPKLVAFYATHPRDAYEALIDSLDEAGRQSEFGNFDKSTGLGPNSESHAFSFWSSFKRKLFFLHGARFALTFVGLTALFAGLLWRMRNRLPSAMIPAACALIASACAELFIASMLDSADIQRHHFVFFALFDMMFIATIFMAITARRGLSRAPTRSARAHESEQKSTVTAN